MIGVIFMRDGECDNIFCAYSKSNLEVDSVVSFRTSDIHNERGHGVVLLDYRIQLCLASGDELGDELKVS